MSDAGTNAPGDHGPARDDARGEHENNGNNARNAGGLPQNGMNGHVRNGASNGMPNGRTSNGAHANGRTGSGIDYFASDVHISEDRPDVTDRFLRFLDMVMENNADRLFLLGDIFDIWVGHKQAKLSYVIPVIEKIREVTHRGIEMQYIAGNRDFNFDARVNGGPPPRRLPEAMTIQAGGKTIYLSHGDLFCTGDHAYRRARGIGRSTPVRMALSHMPLGLSSFLSQGYRRLSARAVAQKSLWEKAIDFSSIRSHLLDGHDTVLCGHVHRAARYRVDLPDNRSGEFITLGDWTRYGVYLVAQNDSLDLKKFA